MSGEIFLWLVTDSKTAGFARPELTGAEAMLVAMAALLIGGWLFFDALRR